MHSFTLSLASSLAGTAYAARIPRPAAVPMHLTTADMGFELGNDPDFRVVQGATVRPGRAS